MYRIFQVFQEKNNCLTLNVYVVPKSSKSEIVGIYNNCLKIKLKALPVDNEANEELIKFLASKLKISKSNLEIISGLKQKKKTLLINGCSSGYIAGILVKG